MTKPPSAKKAKPSEASEDEFRWIGEEFLCDSCESIAPVIASTFGYPETTKNLCDVCYSTFIGTVTRYPGQFDSSERMLFITIAQCTNMLIDKITGRKPTMNESKGPRK